MKKMKTTLRSLLLWQGVIASVLALSTVSAEIITEMGPTFNLTASEDYITTPDGGAYLMWGYGVTGRTMQYVGPTLEVNEGDTVTVNLTNELSVPVSLVFPGQTGVSASGDKDGLLTKEANPGGGTAQYIFVASHPGTYLYHSGTQPELQIEMGLIGAMIVRPAGQPEGVRWAYNHADSAYDYEYLFLLTEMDPVVHQMIQCGKANQVDLTSYFPVLWFINGRCAPDTMMPAETPLLPTQPYNCIPRLHPGDRILLRFLGGSRDYHPFHTHGNNFLVIAQDGRLLSSAPGAGADLAVSNFTQTVAPGATCDAIFTWTGEKLGWDIYGHSPEDPLEMNEYGPDHGKPFPVMLPDKKDLTFGLHWSGSPFLGTMESLPPGEGGFNMNAGYFYMWHSHKEKEMVNNDIFPGGMMTMLIVEPHSVPIEGGHGH
jgi:FtsP/CotA-like multicopper oxidase with cupredoxin domain